MGRIVVTEFITVDGVMQDPGGSEGFSRGGWAFKFDRGPEGDKFKMEELQAAEAQLLGRVTYQGFAEAWPSRTGDFADRINNTPKYVVSTTLKNPSWKNTTVIDKDVVHQLAQLRKQVPGNILVAGSATLVNTLLKNHLVDELRLMVFPIILGEGKRLFDQPIEMSSLRLAESRPVGSGVMTLVYRAESPASA